eukprot:TRINITY_DN22703_c0_g1_i3.p1 TRINITY_DN22703_c0_g1~~TRINITY_DN22703_c0_g1_i3.p1  ORF type:complete len:1134 (-),score=284.86 TRINITY_DN22703_c0_g1_i3:180-3581(-)
MSAKLLQALTDENPDLQKQIGCMTGIFQLFDRHHILSAKRINGHTPKRLFPGHSQLNGSSPGVETIAYSPQTALERNLSKNVNENQRNSIESSRASFSSSCSSSFSSLDCNKTTQAERPSFDRTNPLERSSRNSPKSKNSDINSRPNNYALCRDQPHYPLSGRDSLDLRDVVKDSIYRDAHALSVKTIPGEEPIKHVLKHRDSPRPVQLSKSVDGSAAVGINGKPKLPSDFSESLQVLAKLKEAPWFFDEVREPLRSPSETKYSSFSASKDAPRFSYDGREISRPSIDSRDGSKSTLKQREHPRLSLDSREGSMRSNNFDTKSSKSNLFPALNLEKELASSKRPPSVVAKLMGLEAMPNSSTAVHEQMGWMKDSPDDDRIFDGERNAINLSKVSKATEDGKQDRSSRSPRGSFKDPISPRRRNPDLVMKPISSSRFPIETAPWRQPDRAHSPQKAALKHREANAKPPTPISVYSEIEKRLKELEFHQSGKDLRALKQILDAIQSKGLLENNREDQAPHFQKNYDNQNPLGLDRNPRFENRRNIQSSQLISSPTRGSSANPRSFESPIVIMKPAKFINRSTDPTSSVIPLDGLSGVHKFQSGDAAGGKRVSVNTRTVKDPTPKVILRGPITPNLGSVNKKINGKNEDNSSEKPRMRLTQISSRPQPRESTSGSSMKSSGSLSPRLQQKKLNLEKKSRPPIPLADSSKSRRQTLKQQSESGSSGGKHRPKPAHAQQNDDQSSDISSETRKLSYQGDEISVQSDSNISLASQMDSEVTSADRSIELDFFQPSNSNQSPAQRATNDMVSSIVQKKSFPSMSEDGLSVELTVVAPEQPSPVSVLDVSFYKDDLPPSPVKKSEDPFKDDESRNLDGVSGEEYWNQMDLDTRHPDISSRINHKKLENIERLVQKLRRLNSAHDEVAKDHIASLCENANPDHRYVSEILLASGLLLKDLSSGPTQIQLHPSGQPINPDLFLVLEQTKISCFSKTESACENLLRSKSDKEKLHRKLLFDTVNEILIHKLSLAGPQPEPWLQPTKLAGMIPSGQRLLKELCLEIDRLQSVSLDDSDDGLKSILREDVMHQVDSWKDFRREVSSVVLDIERSVFKDLVDEIVTGESSASLQAKRSRRRRQLFSK